MVQAGFLLLSVLLFLTVGQQSLLAMGQVTLTWTPAPLQGTLCPNSVQMTCHSPHQTLQWYLSGSAQPTYDYTYSPSDTFPRPPTLDPSLPGVRVEILRAGSQGVSSVLSANLSALLALNVQHVQCGSGAMRSQVVTPDSPPPSLPSVSCSLEPLPDVLHVRAEVSLQWSSSFTSQYAVERYHVSVNPDPSSSCSSEQVTPSEDFNCSGLVLGTLYTFTVSAINCGDREGERTKFTVMPSFPVGPLDVEVIPLYLLHNKSTSLAQVQVKWNSVSKPHISDTCWYNNTLMYNLTLEAHQHSSPHPHLLLQHYISESECESKGCGLSYPAEAFDSYFSKNVDFFSVNVSACNEFGCSSHHTAYGGNGFYLLPGNFTLSLTSMNCVTFATCSSAVGSGWCTIQYTKDSTYGRLSQPINFTLNSQFALPKMESSTTYYFQVMVTVNSTAFHQRGAYRRSFTTEKLSLDHRLSTTNQVFVSAGVISLLVVFFIIVTFLVLSSFINKKSKESDTSVKLSVKCVMLISMLMLVAVVLWVTASSLWMTIIAPYVGQQQETCAEEWQSTKDDYILAAFLLSLMSFVLATPTLLVAILAKCLSSRKPFLFSSSASSQYTQL